MRPGGDYRAAAESRGRYQHASADSGNSRFAFHQKPAQAKKDCNAQWRVVESTQAK
jgi:hypothetical protein